MRYRLRTLLILLAVAPPLLAGAWFGWQKYLEERERQRVFDELVELITTTCVPETGNIQDYSNHNFVLNQEREARE